MRAIDLTGQRFGRGIVLEPTGSRKGRRYWRLECDCGNTYEASTELLRRARQPGRGTRSCGCAVAEVRTHGPRVRMPGLADKFRAALLAAEPRGLWIETPGPLDTPCWIWALEHWLSIEDTYGYLTVNGKQVGAHRFAFETINGPLGELCALHRCDDRRCVRPSHLFAGTKADNIRDAKAKGRTLTGEAWKASHVGKLPSGDDWRAAHDEQVKLTREQVWEIFDRRKAGESNKEIAKSLGVSEALVSSIYHGKRWQSEQWLK